MKLNSLRLSTFRSYERVTLEPPEGVTVIVGENGAGKTNLLEAVHLCCLGRSHRTTDDSEMIAHHADTAASYLSVSRRDGTHEVGVRLYREQKRKKLLYVNGKTASRMGDLIGHATCVIFSPEDLSVVKGGPAVRRRYLDMLLSQLQRPYFYALQAYHSTLRQRNALLRAIAFGGDAAQLDVWDEQLAQAAAPIVRLRSVMIGKLDQLAEAHYAYIGGREEERFHAAYQTGIDVHDALSSMRALLAASREEDMRRQTTTAGPHRDDLLLRLSDRSLEAYGSQGQARTAALALKLASFDVLSESQGEPPLLLLDDVLSELDPQRRNRLIERVQTAQALLTCTDPSDFTGAEPAKVLHVRAGGVIES
ncbi:MAG: DNA replication/repair protein RecF [Clostridia bacterium]|nr:DNA replication/repair protein RecF [Clostridia bacterium]